MIISIRFFYFLFFYTSAQPHNLNVSDLNIIKTIQNLFCTLENTCSNQTYISEIPLPEDETSTMYPEDGIYLPAIPPINPSSTCCGKCSCEIENCEISDSCCIEALEELWPNKESKTIMACDYPQLRPHDEAYINTGVPILMLRECPNASNIDTETVSKCELSDKYQDIETKIPVTDNATMYIYKNCFCAFCHNVTETTLHYWEVTLECLRGMIRPRNISSVVTEVLKSESCNLLYSRPASLGKRGPFFQCREVISQCNITGQWKTYNSFIEAACLAYSTIYNFKYRNVFCYLCNTNDIFGLNYCTDTSRPFLFVDFRALIRFQPGTSPSKSNSILPSRCSNNKMYDPVKRRCRDVECLFPKTLDDGRCINLVENLGGITYGIYLKLTPFNELESDNFPALHIVSSEIKEEIYVYLKELVQDKSTFSFSLYSKIKQGPEENPFITDSKISYFVVYLQVICYTLSVVKSDIVDKLLSFHDTLLSTRNLTYNGTVNKYHVELDVYQANSTILDQFYKSVNIMIPVLTEKIPSRYPVTVLSLPYSCPSVRLLSNEFNIVRLTETIFIEEYNATIKSNEVLIERLSDGKEISVRLCARAFERIVQQFSANAEPSKTTCDKENFSVETILTFVCTTLSICFSALTIAFYLKFKKFNTQPGVNNIVLCFSLISAQSLYQFGSGHSCRVSKLSCQVIGIFVHFSWLFLMFWMNSCCIHMFRVFKLHQTKMAVFNVAKTTLIYVAYSFSFSLILILTNVIVSLITSNASDIGYGGSLCYISQGHMVAYLFSLPVAAVVLVNIILFTIVVLQMRHTSKVQNDTNRQQFLHIYAKLSTLTGCTWAFGFCSYFLNIAVLGYVFIILNASQGIFLFFAFVANWRTLKSVLTKKGNTQSVDNNKFSNIGSVTNSSTLTKRI